MKCCFIQASVLSILLYGCITWTLTKRKEKKLDSNFTRMLQAILNKSWRQHPKKQLPYGHLPPITKTIKVSRIKHAGQCWRRRDELMSDVLLWTPFTWPSNSRATSTNLHTAALCGHGCKAEDLPEAMDNRELLRERVRNIRADTRQDDKMMKTSLT